jgi:hypothetical protein
MHDGIPEDTTPEAWAHWISLWRTASPAQKAARVGELNHATRTAALAGIRQRHPEATEQDQRMYLAALLFGDDLVRNAYGWDPAVRGR